MLLERFPTVRKGILWADIVLNLTLLGYFKYLGLFARTLNHLLPGEGVIVPQIALPIGISFFTFQALSYVIDVYRGECRVQHNLLSLALYISFFPQLIADPIVKYKDVNEQIAERTLSREKLVSGIRRFIYGLAKKVLISMYWPGAQTGFCIGYGGADLCIGMDGSFLYTFQIYYDFSGYSDMAIGLGRMFGFEFHENFRYPYLSLSVREFWRRWHISLSTWFREYVYIPLGGNRKEPSEHM